MMIMMMMEMMTMRMTMLVIRAGECLHCAMTATRPLEVSVPASDSIPQRVYHSLSYAAARVWDCLSWAVSLE